MCTGCGVVHRKVPHEERAQRVQPGHGQPPRYLHPLCAGGARRWPPSTPTTAPCSRTASAASAAKVCTAGAIDYKQKDEFIEEKYGAIVVATGFNPIKLDKFDEFAYSQIQGRYHLAGAGAPDERCRPHRRHPAAPLRRQASPHHRVRPVRGLPRYAPAAASPTAPRSAACTPPSTPC